ncbi:MAG: hypothetical protein OEV64_04440 [Desulfobulbaceae bacterium]|nr:hypothetical protein [Desulfobulbaceae bacterium]
MQHRQLAQLHYRYDLHNLGLIRITMDQVHNIIKDVENLKHNDSGISYACNDR